MFKIYVDNTVPGSRPLNHLATHIVITGNWTVMTEEFQPIHRVLLGFITLTTSSNDLAASGIARS
jgi:hypothetical protein